MLIFIFIVEMTDIDELEKLLRQCKEIHARFNFTALKQLHINDTGPVIQALFDNFSECIQARETPPPTQATYTQSTTQFRWYNSAALSAYFVIIAVVGLTINLGVIGTICRVRRLWTITNAFVLSLAMADFFMASVLVPLEIKYIYSEDEVSRAKDTLITLLGVASLLNLTAVTLERFISICYPLTSDTYLTRIRATIIIATIWLLSFFQAFLNWAFIGKSHFQRTLYEDLRFALAFCLPCVCILIVNIKLFCVARVHAHHIHAANPQGSRGANRAFIKKMKTAKIIALLVGTFMVTWLPYFSLTVYDHHHPNSVLVNRALDVTEATVCATALLNPLLYGLLRRDVREAMFRGITCQNVNQTEIHSFSNSFRTEHNTCQTTIKARA